MILVDDRQGSKHLVPLLEKAKQPVTLDRLEFADVAFAGLGPDEDPVSIGIEIKTVNEMVDDLVKPRFSGHQLPGLQQTYDWAYLLIEGPGRPNAHNGILEVPRGKAWKQVKLGKRYIPYVTLWKHLYTICHKAGVGLVRAYHKPEVVTQVITLYRWWSEGWDRHASHERMYRRPITKIAPPVPHSLVRRIAADLPAIGRKRSAAVEQHFTSVAQMVLATEEEWRSIEGIGKETARRVMQELEGRHGPR